MRRIVSTEVVFLRKEANEAGYDDPAIRRALGAGEIVRVRHGAYVFADHWHGTADQERHLIRAAAVMRQARCRSVLSHISAAICLGADVWDLSLEEVHLTRRDKKGGRREAGVVQHRRVLLADDTIVERNWRCTSPLRTALDITTITDVEHAMVVVSSLLHEKRLTKAALVAGAETMRNVPHSLTTNLVVRLADARYANPGESRTAYLLWSQGLPGFEPQYEIRDEWGTLVAYLDFAWPELGVWLEFDGKGKYTEYLKEGETIADVVTREKAREDDVRRLTGWICVRITWDDLRRPWEVARRIRAAIAQQASRVR